jgi:IPT/TIG domain
MNEYADITDPNAKAEARDLALLAAQIVAWAGPNAVPFEQALITAWGYLDKASAFIAEEAALGTTPALTSLAPATLTVPGPDSEVILQGTGFNENTVINWNGGDEPTQFVSETELRTVVKPSTVEAPLPFTLPVYVHHGDLSSNVVDFTFTEAAGRERHAK